MISGDNVRIATPNRPNLTHPQCLRSRSAIRVQARGIEAPFTILYGWLAPRIVV